VIGLVAGAAVLGSLATTAIVLMERDEPDSNAYTNVVHDVTLSYMYETDPGSASGTNGMKVESIQFHPGYVVVTGELGQSSVFAVERLRSFHFRPADSE
jgi:hypothetical protein